MLKLQGQDIYLAALERKDCKKIREDNEYDFENPVESTLFGWSVENSDEWFDEIQRLLRACLISRFRWIFAQIFRCARHCPEATRFLCGEREARNVHTEAKYGRFALTQQNGKFAGKPPEWRY